jgi:hypothetical protein
MGLMAFQPPGNANEIKLRHQCHTDSGVRPQVFILAGLPHPNCDCQGSVRSSCMSSLLISPDEREQHIMLPPQHLTQVRLEKKQHHCWPSHYGPIMAQPDCHKSYHHMSIALSPVGSQNCWHRIELATTSYIREASRGCCASPLVPKPTCHSLPLPPLLPPLHVTCRQSWTSHSILHFFLLQNSVMKEIPSVLYVGHGKSGNKSAHAGYDAHSLMSPQGKRIHTTPEKVRRESNPGGLPQGCSGC